MMMVFEPKCDGRNRARPFYPPVLAMVLILFAVAGGHGADAENGEVDASTSASVDATTGASQTLEPVTISGNFSVAYAHNDDGALFIQARDLADAYHRDELASDSIFKGNRVVIRGTIEKTSKPDAAKPWVGLVGDEASGKKIRCSLKAGQLSGKTLGKGDSVQIRGVCEGMKLSVSVVEGELLE